MENIRIIQFEEKYRQQIRDINVSVSSHPNKPQEEKLLCRFVYIDYYLTYSCENCFVAVNENDEVVGYVVSEPDFNRYKDIMLNHYMQEAVKLRADFKQYLYNEVGFYERWNDQYQAHMHMDVKPGWQHQGIGSELIQHQMDYYRQKEIKGMMLLCSAENIRANKFYEKNGLPVIETASCNIRGVRL